MGHDSLVGHDGGEVVVGWYLVGYLSPSLVGSWLGPVNLFFHNINQKTLTGPGQWYGGRVLILTCYMGRI